MVFEMCLCARINVSFQSTLEPDASFVYFEDRVDSTGSVLYMSCILVLSSRTVSEQWPSF